ncbi:Putative dual-specificity RNA methyltransferase RlmN [Durusdinium trenchii]|uniref:Dual-specificity RNA methyltransferase RlmN n=1 Tax=Durusdinium trenchii TaxID=1381693 RepID=A0ABP0MAR1_9DINO
MTIDEKKVPYNPTSAGEEAGFQVPTPTQLRDFRSLLRSLGFRATVRWSTTEGRVMGAACGQLAARGQMPEAEHTVETTNRAPGRTAAQLTWTIHRATAEELLVLLQEHESVLNGIHISAAFMTLARAARAARRAEVARWRRDEGFAALLRRVQELEDLSAQCLANVIWSLAKIGHKPGHELLSSLCQKAEFELEHFWPRNLANTLWSLARLQGAGAESFLAAAVHRLPLMAAKMTPPELTNSLWALARLRLEPSDKVLDGVTASACPERWKPQDITNALWAFSVLQYQPSSEFMQALTSESQRRLSQFKADELALCVRSWSRLSGCQDAWLRGAAQRLAEEASQLRTERLADAIGAFADLTVRLEASSGLIQRWAGRPASLPPKALLLRLDSLARMGLRLPEEALVAWQEAVRLQLPKLETVQQERGWQAARQLGLMEECSEEQKMSAYG